MQITTTEIPVMLIVPVKTVLDISLKSGFINENY
jgi:hypothetical protein